MTLKATLMHVLNLMSTYPIVVETLKTTDMNLMVALEDQQTDITIT